MRCRLVAGALTALALVALTLAPAADASLPSAVSQTPVGWTPNVSADATVGQEDTGSGPACNATFFGAHAPCQSEVYGTAYVNGDVVVVGAFTHACQPGKLSQHLCQPGTQVVRDDIFAYKADSGVIDPHFKPVLNAGPAYTVISGPGNTVYVGGGFSDVNGAKHQGLVQLHVNPGVTKGADADGTVDTSFGGSVGDIVKKLARHGNALYVGGQFGSADGVRKFADGTAVGGLARLNALTGALDPTFAFGLGDPPGTNPIKAEAISLSPSGSELAVSGSFQQVNGQSRPRLAIINTGTNLEAKSALADFTAPVLANDCQNQHDYVRDVSFSPDGTFVVIGDTGYESDGSTPYSICDAVARFDVNASDTTTTGTPVDVTPAWINYGGGDSFYSVTVAGGIVYAGGHNRWVNNQCGNNAVCDPNAVLVDGLSALDANTGLALAWWHPQTTRGDGTMYLSTFGAKSYDGSSAGLAMGTDVDIVGGAYHAENALFPLAATTSANRGGPIPSGLFNEEGGSNTGTPMCVDDAGDATTAGSPVELSTCANDPEQNWSLVKGTVQINGLCLGPSGTSLGSPVQLGTCQSGSTSQQWTAGTGNVLVNSAATSANGQQVCLDDPGSSTTNGTQLDIQACDGGQNQTWPLPSAQGPPTGAPTGPLYPELEQKDTQVPCLDDASDSLAAGNKVQIWTCEGDPQEQWTLQSDGTIRLGSDHCLDSPGAKNGSNVVLEPCSGATSQVWTVGSNYSLVQQSSGLCLSDPADKTANAQVIQVWACNGSSYQAWRLPAN
jgi:hypothetical protein